MGIEQLTEKLKAAYYTTPADPNDPGKVKSLEEKINTLVTNLKDSDKYKDCSDDDLYNIARAMIRKGIVEQVTSTITTYATADGRPIDPIWDQFTYDEILGMAEDGVYVPQEILDWANGMADTDTTSYEIETTASSDSNTVSNLELDTDDTTRVGQQKKLQKFASKAEQQEDLLQEKSNELQEQGRDLESAQSDLEDDQKLTIDKINKLSQEFKTLDRKAQGGDTLSDEELRRYKELGTILNTQGQELIAQSENVEADIRDLLTQMNEVNTIIDVNKEISRTLESLSLPFAEAEGGKRHSYSNTSGSGLNTFGMMEAYAYAAQGMGIASTSGMIGVKLNFDSEDLQIKLNSNATIAGETIKRIGTIRDSFVGVADASSKPNMSSNAPQEENTTEENPTDENPQTIDNEKVQDIQKAEEEGVIDITNPEPEQTSVVNNNKNTATTQKEADVAAAVINNPEDTVVVTGAAAPAETQITNNPDQTAQADGVQAGTTATTAATETAPTENAEGTTDAQGTTDTEAVQGAATDDTANTDNTGEMDPEEAAVREYLTGCSSKSTELQTKTDTVAVLRDEVKGLENSRLKDTIKSTVVFNAAFKDLEKLMDKVRGGNGLTDADIAEYQRLSAILDSQDGSIAVEMQTKVNVLNEFSSSVESGLTLSNDSITYAETAAEAGRAYALEHVERQNMPTRLMLKKDGLKDLLYGKSGESVGRDVIDSAEALAGQAKIARRMFAFSSGLKNFASTYSAQLSDTMNDNNAKVSPLTQEFQQLLNAQNAKNAQNGQNGQNGLNGQADSVNGTSNSGTKTQKGKEEKASQDDVDDVENKGKTAEDQAKDAKKADKEAVDDKKKADQDIKKNTLTMRRTQAQIKALTTENTLANSQIVELMSQAEGEIQAIQSLGGNMNNNNNAQTPVTKTMNSTGAVTGGNSGTSNNSNTSIEIQGKVAMLGTIAQQSQQLGLRVTSNGRTINVLEAKTIKADRAITRAANAKYKIAVDEQKEKEQEIKDNQKLTKTISDIGKVFTATKLAGMGLMMTLWGYAAGLVMFTVGKYGEIATYVTNAAINVAQGNLLGAAINIGAAALSFASTPPTSAAATEGVKESAKAGAESAGEATGNAVASEGAAAAGENVGTNLVEGAGAEIAKDTGSEVVKDAGTEVVKDAGAEAVKDAGTEVVKDAGAEVAKDTGAAAAESAVPAVAQGATVDSLQESVKALTQQVTSQAATQGIEESMKELSKKITEQMAAEFAKNAAKEQLKTVITNTVIEAGKQTLLSYGEKLQQKDSKEDTKKKVLVKFERQKRDEMRKGIEKIKKSLRAR